MIVLAVLGMAIGISYATANRSLADARQAQENSQATTLIQGQAEALRAMAGNPSDSPDYIFKSGTFCIGPGNQRLDAVDCAMGEDHRYHIRINWSGAGTDTFTIRATWEDISGDITDSSTLVYRVHKGESSAPTEPVEEDPGPGPGPVGGGGCPASSTGDTDQTVTGTASGSVWGSGPYTNDSNVGKAAVHAGLITVGQTASIRVCAMPGQSSYTGSTKNGVTTQNWGSWPGSFTLILVGGSKNCPAGSSGHTDQSVTGSKTGIVWGSDPYTDDSSVATAAVHAGLIAAGEKATIRVCAMPGQSSYTGSTKNGVTTYNWASWPGSFTLILLSGG
jgi:type II secretory pathway pseudopilin PulG